MWTIIQHNIGLEQMRAHYENGVLFYTRSMLIIIIIIIIIIIGRTECEKSRIIHSASDNKLKDEL